MSHYRVSLTKGTFLGIMVMVAAVPIVGAADSVDVIVGHSEVLRPNQTIGTLVVGDPEIADATAGAGYTIIVTGKMVGTTNLIALDETGAEVFATTLQIVPVDRRREFTVVVIQGGSKEGVAEYSCGPKPGCAPTREAAQAPTSYTVVLDGPSEGQGNGTATMNTPTQSQGGTPGR
jgi:hypothetical protein